MTANLIRQWTVDHLKVARRIQELEIAGSERLDEFLEMLCTDTRLEGAGAAIESLNERGVDELLDRAATPRQLLREIDALDAAAQRWRSALGGLREAMEAHASPKPLTPEPRLCEADDEYWYL